MLVFKLEINGGPQKIARTMKPAVTIGCARAVKYWHNDFLPRHFATGAATKYHYKRRTAEYYRRKRRRGIAQPLVYSGRARRILTRSFAMSVRASKVSLRATGVFSGVGNNIKYFWLLPAGNAKNQPNKPREIHALTGAEINKLARVARDVAASVIKKTRSRKRIYK